MRCAEFEDECLTVPEPGRCRTCDSDFCNYRYTKGKELKWDWWGMIERYL